MKYALILVGIAALIAVALSGEGPVLMKSIIRGLGWGIGREVAHSVVHHVLR
jgi:glycerol uptake facilitator-like aquaporin